MNCPVCDDVKMREVDRDGVTIDICPQCKGVWLDRGELDKLMSGAKEIRDDFNTWYTEKYYKGPYSHPTYYKKKKKKHFLDMMFDIFD
jgi:hypothetical protein